MISVYLLLDCPEIGCFTSDIEKNTSEIENFTSEIKIFSGLGGIFSGQLGARGDLPENFSAPEL